MLALGFALLTGLGIFLLGMYWLEQGIQNLGSSSLKRWLSLSTTSWRSAGFGIIITSILQSSSMVSLLVLAFTSAGIIQLYSAIGIILGSSIGTTVTGWIVMVLGFKLDLAAFALPLLGISAFVLVFSKRGSRSAAVATILISLGLLLFGLDQMKNSMAALPANLDLQQLQGQPMWVYLLCGVAISAIIQSSSATMILTLTALHSDFIQLQAAAAIMIGVNTGTSTTTILGSIAGSAVKKRLALASCVFHVSGSLLAFLVLLPLLPLLLSLANIHNPLFALVAFHTLFNCIAVLSFLPFLQHYTRWVERFFCCDPADQPSLSMPAIVPQVVEAAIPALIQATLYLLTHAMDNSLQHFQLYRSKQGRLLTHKNYLPPPPSRYQELKTFEGQLLYYITLVQRQPLDTEQAQHLAQLRESCRGIVYACKSLNDIDHDIEALYSAGSDIDKQLFASHQTFIKEIFTTIFGLLANNTTDTTENIEQLLSINNQQQQKMNGQIYQIPGQLDDAHLQSMFDTWMSSQLNANHEIHHAIKSLLNACNLLLELQQHSLPDLDYTGILVPANN